MSIKVTSKNILKLIFALVLIKSIVWVLLIPLWHSPDEQAHFGHVAYLAEGHPLPHGKNKDLTEEIYTSEEILGTKRDLQGNNQFTYHPEFRLDYSQNLTGPEELKIKNLPLETRKNLVYKESAYYPHFFYQVSAKIYNVFYQSNLFIRVFSVRLFWLLAHVLTIYFSLKIAQLVFPKNYFLIILSIILTAMHPMYSFVSSGVTSDSLHNLSFAAVIYFSLALIKSAKLTDLFGLVISFGFGLVNKPQFLLAGLIVIPALISLIIKKPKSILKVIAILVSTLLIAYLLSPVYVKPLITIILSGKIPYFDPNRIVNYVRPDYSLFDHLRWTVNHTIREVLPWYWGVFNWLGVTLPRWVNRVLMRLLVVSGLGLVIKAIKIFKRKQFTLQNKLIGFLAYSALIYFLSLFFWDWHHVKANGFSFGIQGRYYFPTLIPHMILLVVGYTTVVNLIKSKKIRKFLKLLLALWFIFLQLIGLHTLAKAYYDLSSFKVFIVQASQYKPWFAKGIFLSSSLTIYLVLIITLILSLTHYFLKNET